MSHSSLPIYSMYEFAPTLQIGTPKVKKYQKMQFTVILNELAYQIINVYFNFIQFKKSLRPGLI